MYLYQENERYFAQIADDIRDIGEAELTELGAREIVADYRGLHFSADKATLYRINYGARLITRVLSPLVAFEVRNVKALYARARYIKWTDFLSTAQTFAVYSHVSDSQINHSQHAALSVKDAIADWFRKGFRMRPDVDNKNPDVWFNLHIREDQATISVDTSGGSLHRRGYRKAVLAAPMQETTAAAIIRLSDWDGSVPLYDPMCGSGTLLTEALMHYCRMPAGIFRKKFGFECMPDFDAGIWQTVKTESDARIRELPEGLIGGSDLAAGAIAAAGVNLNNIRHGDRVALKVSDFRDIKNLENSAVVVNPPYGIRIGADSDLKRFYGKFGDFLKQRAKGSTAYIYFGDRAFIKNVGLKTSWKRPLKAGGLDGRLAKFELH
jgi:putative N6-adenine-specific DNA methylase